MIHRRRQAQPDENAVPPVLPLISVEPDGPDAFTIKVNGTPLPEGPVPRNRLGHALAGAAEQLASAVRVEVHDTDGRVHADIIHPPAAAPVDQQGDTRSGDRFAITYTGFLPGERVLIALVDRAETANADGTVTVHVDQTLAGARDVVLIGSVSQTTILAGLS